MEWLNSDVRSAQRSLKEAPEIFNSLRMNLPFDVFPRVIDDAMHEGFAQILIGDCAVGVQRASTFDVIQDRILQSLTANIGNHFSADFAGHAVQHSDNSRLAQVNITAPLLTANLLQLKSAALVHLNRVSANVSFVTFYRTAGTTTELALGFVLHSFTNPMQHEPSG